MMIYMGKNKELAEIIARNEDKIKEVYEEVYKKSFGYCMYPLEFDIFIEPSTERIIVENSRLLRHYDLQLAYLGSIKYGKGTPAEYLGCDETLDDFFEWLEVAEKIKVAPSRWQTFFSKYFKDYEKDYSNALMRIALENDWNLFWDNLALYY